MVDLGVCMEALRRAFVYGMDILEYREHPRVFARRIGGKERARIATEGFLEAIRAIAENCPLEEHTRRKLLGTYRSAKESPWETVARYVLSEYSIKSAINDALEDLRKYFGFEPEKYEKYIPE